MRSPFEPKEPEDQDPLSAPDSKAGKLQLACLDLLREHQRKGEIPTNGRFLFYELEQRGVIPKKYDGINPDTGKKWARTPLQDVSVATMHLRDCGLIPWHWIEDETRSLSQWRYADSVLDYLLDTVALARIDLWQGETAAADRLREPCEHGRGCAISRTSTSHRSPPPTGNAAVSSSPTSCRC